MPINRRHLVSIFKDRVEQIDEDRRVPGYRVELLKRLTAIIEAEQEHKVRSINVQQRVNDECNRLGAKLQEGDWAGSD